MPRWNESFHRLVNLNQRSPTASFWRWSRTLRQNPFGSSKAQQQRHQELLTLVALYEANNGVINGRLEVIVAITATRSQSRQKIARARTFSAQIVLSVAGLCLCLCPRQTLFPHFSVRSPNSHLWVLFSNLVLCSREKKMISLNIRRSSISLSFSFLCSIGSQTESCCCSRSYAFWFYFGG